MSSEAGKLGKCCAADTTTERTLAIMRALMGFEMGKLDKRCTTDTTGERTLAGMRPLMRFQRGCKSSLVRSEPAPM